jgi:N-acetyl-anhydromuramyl-L-alanine amidase AmpD
VHHSGGRAVTAVDRAAAGRAIRAIQDEHIRRRGWNDIGYHYIVDRAGRVWEGRPASQIGAHAGSSEANRGNLGVLLLGNFELQQPAPAQIASAERLLEALRRRHKLPRVEVLSHGDVRRDCGLGPTTCPGKNLVPWVERYRRGVARSGGDAEVRVGSGTPSRMSESESDVGI